MRYFKVQRCQQIMLPRYAPLGELIYSYDSKGLYIGMGSKEPLYKLFDESDTDTGIQDALNGLNAKILALTNKVDSNTNLINTLNSNLTKLREDLTQDLKDLDIKLTKSLNDYQSSTDTKLKQVLDRISVVEVNFSNIQKQITDLNSNVNSLSQSIKDLEDKVEQNKEGSTLERVLQYYMDI